MPDNDLIDELMLRWEAARQQGVAARPEDLCAEHPEHASELERRIRAVQAMEQVLGVNQIHFDRTETPDHAAPPPAPSDEEAAWREKQLLPQIPGYQLVRIVDEGGMGVVYEAIQTDLGRRVAIKMISGLRLGPTQLARFRTEVQASARLQHANFVQIFEVGQVKGRPFFSMEYVDGGSLAQHLKKSRPSPRHAAELIHTLAQAIHTAHECGIVHRDLKPANILLAVASCQLPVASNEERTTSSLATSNWQLATAKIADFGLAKRLGDDSGHTHTGEILGTPSYMAPEQAAGQKEQVGPATDVYALGAILYEMLAGRPPFQGATALDSLRMVTTEEAVPPARLAPATPRELEAICLKCLEKTPPQRYASARELADDLERFLNGQPVKARRISTLQRAWKWIRRHPQSVALTVALSALAVFPVWYLISAYRTRGELRLKAEAAAPLVREILHRNCFECHGQDPAKIKKNLNVLDHELLLNAERKLVVPGDPEHSRLIQRIADGSMPPEEDETRLPRLTETELSILRDWIVGGAPPLPEPDPQQPTSPVVLYSPLAAKAMAILHERCYECHRFDVAKGGIKILNYRLLVTIRKVVVPGKPDESELFKLITSTDDDSRMPPPDEGQPPLSRQEIETIRQWILEGAPAFPKRK